MAHGRPDDLRRRAVRGLVGIMTVPAIFLLMLELVARIADPLGISYYPETARYLDTMIIEEPIGYRNRPNLQGHFWGAPVTINSLGLRDREVSRVPAENEFRILLLGDSGVFGLGVADRETHARQLEGQLNRDADGITYRVINMGVPSYNTEQELIQLQSLGVELHPDLVLLMFSLNDIQPKMWVFERRASLLANFAQRSYAASLLAVFYWEVRFWLTRRDDRAPFRSNLGEHPGWSMVEAAMTRIAALCRQNGIPFVLLVRESHPRLKSLAESLADRGGLWLVDLGALYAADPRWKGAELRLSWVNPHHNRLGIEADSTLLRESLERLGLLPAR